MARAAPTGVAVGALALTEPGQEVVGAAAQAVGATGQAIGQAGEAVGHAAAEGYRAAEPQVTQWVNEQLAEASNNQNEFSGWAIQTWHDLSDPVVNLAQGAGQAVQDFGHLVADNPGSAATLVALGALTNPVVRQAAAEAAMQACRFVKEAPGATLEFVQKTLEQAPTTARNLGNDAARLGQSALREGRQVVRDIGNSEIVQGLREEGSLVAKDIRNSAVVQGAKEEATLLGKDLKNIATDVKDSAVVQGAVARASQGLDAGKRLAAPVVAKVQQMYEGAKKLADRVRSNPTFQRGMQAVGLNPSERHQAVAKANSITQGENQTLPKTVDLTKALGQDGSSPAPGTKVEQKSTEATAAGTSQGEAAKGTQQPGPGKKPDTPSQGR